MSTTEQRRAANRVNALKSTGPTSENGKLTASRNATRHGLLSARLLLNDERPEDFDNLFLDLQSALSPVGCVELALVERIAISLWRQRRVVTAETAAINLARERHHLARGVGEELHPGYGGKFKEEDLQPFDPDRIEFCNAVLAEVQKLETINVATLPELAPTIFGQLQSYAEEDGETIEEQLSSQENGITGYVGGLVEWCHEQLREAAKRPRIVALAEQVRARRLVLPADALEVFSRYQTTLDNQLYKALRALREAQEWRLKTIDAQSSNVSRPVPPDEAA